MSFKNKYLNSLSNYLLISILFIGGLLISGCNEQARGFALPTGDIEAGKEAYKRLACHTCHSISAIEWTGEIDSIKINLGGEVVDQKSYGELVTSVINPSHKISKNYKPEAVNEEGLSKMKNYNEVMTVQELVDLVTFLQSEYKISTPSIYYYPYY